MKNVITLAIVLGALLVMPVPAGAEDTTLTGEPVDISCYLSGKSGEGHAQCAKSCAAKGQPIGLVVGTGDDQQMYLVLGAGGKQAKDVLAEHMGTQVTVTGTVSEKNGMKVVSVSKVTG